MQAANVSAKDAMTLRQRTGLGIMDCKTALAEANGDMKLAEANLREKLKGKMDTRTDRPAGEGCVAIAVDVAGAKATIIELRAETDFTARNEKFRAVAGEIAKMALTGSAGTVAVSGAMTARIDDVRITTGENISLARGEMLSGGSFAQYIHHDGKLGVLLQFEGSLPADIAVGICQHVAAHVPTPQAIDEHGMAKETVAAYQEAATEEAKQSGKPAEIAIKIAQGKMRKFFEENTLLGQKFVKDDKKAVKELLPAGVKITRFVRYQVGGA